MELHFDCMASDAAVDVQHHVAVQQAYNALSGNHTGIPAMALKHFHRIQAANERLDQRRSRNVQPFADEDKTVSLSALTHGVALVAPIAEAVITASVSAYGIHSNHVTHLYLGVRIQPGHHYTNE